MEHNLVSRAEMYTDREDPYSAMKQDFSRIFYDNKLTSYANASELGFLDYASNEYEAYHGSKDDQTHSREADTHSNLRSHGNDFSGYGDQYKTHSPISMAHPNTSYYGAVHGGYGFAGTKQQPYQQEQAGYPGFSSQYYYGNHYDPHMPHGSYENGVDYYQNQDMIDTYNNDTLSLMWSDNTNKAGKDKNSSTNGYGDPRRKLETAVGYEQSRPLYTHDSMISAGKATRKSFDYQPSSTLGFGNSLSDATRRKEDSLKYSSKSTISKAEKPFDEDEEEDGDDGFGEGKGRSTRGLRVLSLKVRDIVMQKKRTTYKEVAEALTFELRQNPIAKSAKEEAKDEQNVKRRVYDALNVLIAAGVLRKEGKLVYCEQNGGNDITGRRTGTSTNKNKLEGDLQEAKKRYQAKVDLLQELIFKCLAIKNLVKTNKAKEEEEKLYGFSQKSKPRSVNATRIEVVQENAALKSKNEDVIKFPFIVLLSSSNDNSMNLNMDASQRQLAIDSKKPFNIFGDIDVLLKMGLHFVTREMFNHSIPYELQRYVPKYYLASLK